MKPLRRKPVHKGKSASTFKNNVIHTKALNLSMNPMRGGFRI